VTGPIPVCCRRSAAGAGLDELGDAGHVLGEVAVQLEDAFGQTGRFSTGGRRGESFVSCAPTCCLSDLACTEGPTGIDAEIGDTQQRGQRVHRPGALSGEFIPGGEEDLCRGAHAIVLPRGAQVFDQQRQDSCSDPAGVERVRLPDPVSTTPHPRSLGNLVSGIRRVAGQLRPVTPGALDRPERVGDPAGTAPRPGNRARTARGGIRERLGPEVLAVCGEYCIRVGSGVRVHADDERVRLRDNGVHSVRFLP